MKKGPLLMMSKLYQCSWDGIRAGVWPSPGTLSGFARSLGLGRVTVSCMPKAYTTSCMSIVQPSGETTTCDCLGRIAAATGRTLQSVGSCAGRCTCSRLQCRARVMPWQRACGLYPRTGHLAEARRALLVLQCRC